MNARKHIAVLLSALSICSCTDNSFKGILEEFEEHANPIAVMVAVGEPSGNITTKGHGAIDGVSTLEGKDIMVYAFSKNEERPYDDPSNCLINNRAAKVSKDYFAKWTDNLTINYPSGKDFQESFDFFGYFIEDATVNEVKTFSDSVVLNVTIDGSQDVMVSKAVTSSTNQDIINNSFSYYSAQRNSIPIFYLKHYLTCLNFEIIPGLNSEGEFVKEKITLKSISILTNSTFDLVVASRDESNLGIVKEKGYHPSSDLVTAKERDGSQFTDRYSIITLSDPSEIPEPVAVNSDLLIPEVDASGSQLIVTLECEHINSQGEPFGLKREGNAAIYLEHPEGLKAGNKYKVSLTMYGDMIIHASVDLMNWEDAGEIRFGEEELKPTLL